MNNNYINKYMRFVFSVDAIDVLIMENYDLHVKRVYLINQYTNSLRYQVIQVSGETYEFRVVSDHIVTQTEEFKEQVKLLSDLTSRSSHIITVIPNKKGDLTGKFGFRGSLYSYTLLKIPNDVNMIYSISKENLTTCVKMIENFHSNTPNNEFDFIRGHDKLKFVKSVLSSNFNKDSMILHSFNEIYHRTNELYRYSPSESEINIILANIPDFPILVDGNEEKYYPENLDRVHYNYRILDLCVLENKLQVTSGTDDIMIRATLIDTYEKNSKLTNWEKDNYELFYMYSKYLIIADILYYNKELQFRGFESLYNCILQNL